MSTNLEQDFIDLFSYAKKGHMGKYIYMHRPDIYDTAISQNTYYPFMMERDLIIQKGSQICKTFQDVTQAIEFGPGSFTPIKLKTIPFLKALKQHSSFDSYWAIDSSPIYAKAACDLIKAEFEHMKTEAIEIDYVANQALERLTKQGVSQGNKLIFAFGQSIFANINYEDVPKALNTVAKFLSHGDYLLFGADTNRDETMLERAYNSKTVHELLLNTMYHLKETLGLDHFKPEKFDSVYVWNHKQNTVEHYLKPTLTQTIRIGHQEIVIEKGKEFNILNSRKMDIKSIETFLNQENIFINEVVTLDNCPNKAFSMIIAQKIVDEGNV